MDKRKETVWHNKTTFRSKVRAVMDISQQRMPFVEALEAYTKAGFTAFHTPGHKLGVGAPSSLKNG